MASRSILPAALPQHFAAIDFETADSQPDSACAIGLVLVREGVLVRREYRLIRPPRSFIEFSWLHGITWEHVQKEPDFAAVWTELSPLLNGLECLVAHNAPFDRRVMEACCHAGKLPAPTLPYVCTVRLARKFWGCRPANLVHVCKHLGIELQHHHALSDAEACARIVLAAKLVAAPPSNHATFQISRLHIPSPPSILAPSFFGRASGGMADAHA